MAEVPDDYKHPKCYANTRGGCSSTISGEHYVSHGLIKLYGNNDPLFTVQHKTGKGIGHPVTAKNFKANILCQKHNTALSPADDAALAFATFLRRNALQYDAGAGEWGEAEEITISGDDMQRWVLKLFLNHAVTGHFEEQQDRTVTFPTEAIDLLLNRGGMAVRVGHGGARRNAKQRLSGRAVSAYRCRQQSLVGRSAFRTQGSHLDGRRIS